VGIRVGESWTTRNGHRRWVSVSLGTYLFGSLGFCLGRGLRGLFLLPFAVAWWCLLAELWVCAEVLLLAVSGGLVLADLARRVIRPADVTVTPLRWGLLVIDVKEARP
jgi:hypothetical protein